MLFSFSLWIEFNGSPSIEGGTTVIIFKLWSVRSYAILGQDLIPSFPDLLLSHPSQKTLISSASWLLLPQSQFPVTGSIVTLHVLDSFIIHLSFDFQTRCLVLSDDSISWVNYSPRCTLTGWSACWEGSFIPVSWMDGLFWSRLIYSATVWSNRLIWLINLFHLGGSPIRYPSWLTHVLQGWKTTAAAVCSALITCTLLNWIGIYIYTYIYTYNYTHIYICYVCIFPLNQKQEAGRCSQHHPRPSRAVVSWLEIWMFWPMAAGCLELGRFLYSTPVGVRFLLDQRSSSVFFWFYIYIYIYSICNTV